MTHSPTVRRVRATLRAFIEIAFILFLFYANLLMGEFTRSSGTHKTLAFALRDVVTEENFVIALVTAIVGYIGIEHLRSKV